MALAALFVAPAKAASSVVQYMYDAAGNIIALQRVNPTLTVSGFTPTSGPPGTVVTISGTGFGTIAANNGVAFNGVAATVSTPAANTLTVSVPMGATTGKIAVTVAGNTTVSAQDFVVTVPGAPTIAGFTPAAGPAGTTVTVTGTNLNSATGATSAVLNQTAATVSFVTSTTLALTVPPATGTGRIRIATSGGSAVSAGDFIVPPGTIAAADIVASTRIVGYPARSISILAANKYGMLIFRGNVGDWLSIHLANFAINPAGATLAYTVFKPDNTPLTSGTLSGASLSIHLPQLAVDGAYAVLLASGVAQVSLDAMLETNRPIPSDGTTLAITRSAGQTTRALIQAVAGEQKALMVSEMTSIPAGSNLGYSILLPSGATFRNSTAATPGTTSLLPSFPTTGAYPAMFSPTIPTASTSFKVGLLNGTATTSDAGRAGAFKGTQ